MHNTSSRFRTKGQAAAARITGLSSPWSQEGPKAGIMGADPRLRESLTVILHASCLPCGPPQQATDHKESSEDGICVYLDCGVNFETVTVHQQS